jgi:tetratricopeptide (TPR) repeat protein
MRDADDMTASRRCFEEALTLFRGLGDQLGAAQALCQLGNLLSRAGEHEPARDLLDESLSIRRAGDEARGVGLSLLSISLAEMTAGEFDRARGAADQALALFDRTADGPGQGAAWMVLGYIAASAEDWRHARELQERGLATWRNFNPDARWCGGVFLELVHIEMALGESERAAAHLRDAFASFEHVDDPLGLEQCRAAERELENVALTAD